MLLSLLSLPFLLLSTLGSLSSSTTAAPATPQAHPHARASLSPREVSQLEIKRANRPTCSPAGRYGVQNGILEPASGAQIRPGGRFEVYYCSPTYHETRSVSYDITAYRSSSPDVGVVLARGVTQPISNVTMPADAHASGYDALGVFEVQTGYGGGDYQFARFNRTVRVKG